MCFNNCEFSKVYFLFEIQFKLLIEEYLCFSKKHPHNHYTVKELLTNTHGNDKKKYRKNIIKYIKKNAPLN